MSQILRNLYHGELDPESLMDRRKLDIYSGLIEECREKVSQDLSSKTKEDLERMENLVLSERVIAEELAFEQGFKCAMRLVFNSMYN